MDSMQKRFHNDIAGLKFVHAFGWLRAVELGALLFPKTATATIAASRVIRSWEKRRLVIVRELPDRAGRAVVLAAGGVRFLSENGHTASSGKDLGSTTAGVWKPPASWMHDLIATGALIELRKRGYKVIPEATLRRTESDCPKLPDGLLQSQSGEWVWLEVEHARKTGKNMRSLGQAIALAAAGEIKSIAGAHCTRAMIAYCEKTDERGYALNHKARVLKSVSEYAKKPLEVTLAHCTLVGVGVGCLELEKALVEPYRALGVLRAMSARGWRQEGYMHYCRHSGFSASIGQEDLEGSLWSWQIEDYPAEYAESLTDAKLMCARAIAELLEKDVL